MDAIAMASTSTAAGAAGPQPRLVRAAHEFEAQMLKELLKPMTGKDALTGEDGESGDAGANSALSEFASEALGKALSQGGGFGIANRIVHDLSHSGFQSKSGKVT
jgi:Rod binding domain-containing protein